MNHRITINPDVLGGKPIITGTRISVEFVLGLLAQGWTVDDVLKEYDHITREDVQACLACAHQFAAAEKMAALRTLDYLRSEAAHGRREDFDRFLAAVPDAKPIDTDRMPD